MTTADADALVSHTGKTAERKVTHGQQMPSPFAVLFVVSGLKCFRGNDGKRSCYTFVQVKMTRDKATTYCRIIGEGVDLVSIESQEETNFLASVITGLPSKCGAYHTSGKKTSGAWQWKATGQPFTYTSWAPLEPSGIGNFCFIWNIPPGWKTWDDRFDSEECFICEYRR
ncbi:hypothetical protein LSAT2_026188 [Lamellibrachia satsuma]|nr:hypothetical protein LSAT2_026188 [Lamellibrachia satsuma]